MNGLLGGNLNVTVNFDQTNLTQVLGMIFILILLSALAIKIITKL